MEKIFKNSSELFDLIYKIMFDEENSNDKNFEEHHKVFNQILSSFKFIEN